ncbi:MAG: class 1 isoprenoid biosynthesis enzyme [Candidatus Andersenbacteria bacterium]|nr:class 1 isoprenoid biosynthesis enzyme [Candidatus Andersenbacteria bacterium]MBI3251216.1 class 1 isoprenoid biosynthesis enzyme [Candidatus Andersenbacteria bacterium]
MKAIVKWFRTLGAGLYITVLSMWMRIRRTFETPDLKSVSAHPRLHVYGTFNLWREYCNVSWRKAKRLRSFEIFALIIYHVRLIDDYVDEQLRPQGIPVDSKSLKAGSRQLVQLIRRKIAELPVTDEIKRELVRTFQDYRRRVADAFVVEGHAGHDAPLEAVLQQRWDITALVYITIIRTLNLIHGIDPTTARNIENIFANWSITLQVSDDILDFDADVDSIQNIAVSIARKHPDEMSRWLSRKRVTLRWARHHVPSILQDVNQVWQHYADKMLSIDHDHTVVRVMIIISAVIKRAVLSHFPGHLYKL